MPTAQVTSLLKDREVMILARWRAEMSEERAHLPLPIDASGPGIPAVLRCLEAMLQDPDQMRAPWREECDRHGRRRADEGRLADLIFEHEALRRAVFAALDGSESAHGLDQERLSDLLRDGLAVAAEGFSEVLLGREAELRLALAQSVRARDDYLSLTTHELRTPIASILLGLQVIQKSVARFGQLDVHATERLLEPPIRQATRLKDMVNALLDVSRIENNLLRLERVEIDLHAVARDMVTRLQPLASERGSSLSFISEGPLIGRFDRIRIEQVLSNLIGNAIKYGAGGPVEIQLSALSHGARITVRDNGDGIAPGDHERIFNRYERARATSKHEGLGLGLYIVRELVRAHGGTVHVQSVPGHGAAFVVELPLEGGTA